MSELDEIKGILAQVIQTIDLLTDETAELVDKYHRPYTSDAALPTIPARANVLLAASKGLRESAEKVLGETVLPKKEERP